MGFKPKAYAKIKQVRPDSYGGCDVQITISKKNQKGGYELCFAGWCKLFCKALEKRPKQGEIIQILECDVVNAYVKNDEVFYNKSPIFAIYDLALQNQTLTRVEQEASETVFSPIGNFEEVEFDDIPF